MSAHGATSKPASTLIAGGGLAGLYAAHRLEKTKIPDVLWEAQPGWGGRILALPIEGDWAPSRLGTRPMGHQADGAPGRLQCGVTR